VDHSSVSKLLCVVKERSDGYLGDKFAIIVMLQYLTG
jgi:hypothetical protein